VIKYTIIETLKNYIEKSPVSERSANPTEIEGIQNIPTNTN
jgi:hypothetical protein